MERTEVEETLLELGRQLVGELAGGKVLELMLATAGANPQHSEAGRSLANVRWAKGPGAEVGGRTVVQVWSHPQSNTVLYDLGDGYFAEGERGKAPGTVMREPANFKPALLQEKGWQVEAAGKETEPGTTGGGESGAGGAAPSAASAEAGGGSGPSEGMRPDQGARRAASHDPTRMSVSDRTAEARNREDRLAQALGKGQATDESGTLDGHGQVWHPDRASVHADIVQKHLSDATTVPSQGRAILTGGLTPHGDALAKAGAWKADRYHPVFVEQIIQELAKAGILPELAGLNPQLSGVLAHREAAHIGSMVVSALSSQGKNMVIGGSMTDPDQVKEQAGRLRSAGYGEVRGIHVRTPVDKAVGRARSAGIPASAVLASATSHGGDKSSHGFEKAKQHLDGWDQYDHSGQVPVRVKRGGAPPRSDGSMHSVEDMTAQRRQVSLAAESDHELRLGAVMNWLEGNKLTTEQAAERVRKMHFPKPDEPTVHDRFTEHCRGECALPSAGSFARISASHAAGKINRRTYSALAHAASASMQDDEAKLSVGRDGNVVLGKASHEDVGYEEASSVPGQTCGNCYMYDAGHCTLVEDPIDAGGKCVRWIPDVPE